jgi:1-acyl-sn-glycerol-3-phosphate acyltransferase
VNSLRDNWVFGILSMAFGVLMVIVTVMSILLAAPFLGPRRAFFSIAPMFYRSVFAFCGIRWSIEGWEDLPEAIRNGTQPCIFMCNHESQLDPPFLVGVVPAHPVFIAKKEVKYIPFVGWAAMCAGVIFIDRGHRERAIGSLSQAAAGIRSGKSVVVFPEGTRTRTGKLLPFKKGSFNLALEASVPVVPMGLHGAYEVLAPGDRRIRPGVYRLRVGTPLEPATFKDREALMTETRSRIEALARP